MAKPTCTHVANCELFPYFFLNSHVAMWKSMFCHGNYEKCVRFQMIKDGKPVPVNLLPNGKELPTELG